MNPIESILRSRRTIHEFEPGREPDEAAVERALESACWAPNHHHTEPWRFLRLGPRTREAVCELNAVCVERAQGARAAEKKRERWRSQPGWLVVTALTDPDPLRCQENYAATCCAVQNLLLSLWADGLGVKWATGDVVREARFFDLLGIDPHAEQVVGLFWIGYPATVPKGQRRPAAERTRWLP